jgi:hypothetical protein
MSNGKTKQHHEYQMETIQPINCNQQMKIRNLNLKLMYQYLLIQYPRKTMIGLLYTS